MNSAILSLYWVLIIDTKQPIYTVSPNNQKTARLPAFLCFKHIESVSGSVLIRYGSSIVTATSFLGLIPVCNFDGGVFFLTNKTAVTLMGQRFSYVPSLWYCIFMYNFAVHRKNSLDHGKIESSSPDFLYLISVELFLTPVARLKMRNTITITAIIITDPP